MFAQSTGDFASELLHLPSICKRPRIFIGESLKAAGVGQRSQETKGVLIMAFSINPSNNWWVERVGLMLNTSIQRHSTPYLMHQLSFLGFRHRRHIKFCVFYLRITKNMSDLF